MQVCTCTSRGHGARSEGSLKLAIDLEAAARSDPLVDTVSHAAQSRRLAAAGAGADALLAALAAMTSVRLRPHAPIGAVLTDVRGTPVRSRDRPLRHG